LFLEACCSWVDLLVELLGISVDPWDAPILVISEYGSGSWKATQWWEWSHPKFPTPQAVQGLCVSYRALHRHWDSDENIETTHKSTVPLQSLWMNRQGMSHIDQQYRFCLGMDWRSNSEESHCSPHSKYIAHPWWLMPIFYQQPSLAYLGIPWSTPVAGSMEWHAAEPGWLLEMIKHYNTKGLIMSDIRKITYVQGSCLFIVTRCCGCKVGSNK